MATPAPCRRPKTGNSRRTTATLPDWAASYRSRSTKYTEARVPNTADPSVAAVADPQTGLGEASCKRGRRPQLLSSPGSAKPTLPGRTLTGIGVSTRSLHAIGESPNLIALTYFRRSPEHRCVPGRCSPQKPLVINRPATPPLDGADFAASVDPSSPHWLPLIEKQMPPTRRLCSYPQPRMRHRSL